VKHQSAQKKSQFFDGPPLGKLAPRGGSDPRSGGAWGPHAPRKRFGQHFLTDGGIIHAIVDAIAPKPGQAMVEIGPGLGALTQPLVERLGTLTVIELDRDLAVRLRLRPALDVIESDVLKVDFSHVRQARAAINNIANNIGNGVAKTTDEASGNNAYIAAKPLKLRVVGNLPYNISTPILFHLLDFVDDIEDQHFMLQKEVIDRMVASPATAAYGRLSVMLQWRYAMQNVLFVPPESFEPPPRVDSAVVRMVPRPNFAAVDVNRLSEVVRVAFSQRRKLLRHSLGNWLEEKAFTGRFDLQRRAEEVPVSEYIALAQQM
jgi:16S rRNA (adenine1518-N6/adenine1519-N6)-dimethyltransferase